MQITRKRSHITPENVEAHLTISRDAAIAGAAATAYFQLQRLVAQAVPGDLVRSAAGEPNPLAFLQALAQQAASICVDLRAERESASTVLRDDGVDRLSLDFAVSHLLNEASEAHIAAGKAAAAAADDLNGAQARAKLLSAGLSETEVQRVLDERGAEADPAIAQHRETAASAERRVNRLSAFLRDPLRRRDELGAELLEEVQELAERFAARRGDGQAATRENGANSLAAAHGLAVAKT